MESEIDLKINPLEGFHLLEGFFGVTLSLQRICDYYGYAIDEETVLGLGGGLGFGYWNRKGGLPHLEGFGKTRDFFPRFSVHTGACVSEHTTVSQSKAYNTMLNLLDEGNPVMVYGDIAELPYWREEFLALQGGIALSEAFHYGHHAFIVVGMDVEQSQVLLADLVSASAGQKSGRYEVVSLQELAAARDSRCRNTPPMNRWFTVSFSKAHPPTANDYREAIMETVLDMLKPTINNFGVPGIQKMANDVQNWPGMLTPAALREALFSFYLQTEIVGAGGGNIREIYARFLEKARVETGNPWIEQSARLFRFAAKQWHALVKPLGMVYSLSNPAELLPGLAEDLYKVSYTEETALKLLASAISR